MLAINIKSDVSLTFYIKDNLVNEEIDRIALFVELLEDIHFPCTLIFELEETIKIQYIEKLIDYCNKLPYQYYIN